MLLNSDFATLQAIYPDLFKLMANDGNFYVCLVKPETEGESYKAYLEHPPENANISGILRVFCRKNDANLYAQFIAQAHGMDITWVKRWETSFSTILGYVRDLDMRHVSLTVPGIRAVTSILSDDDIVDADIFWTNEPEKMV